jgi:glutamate synthase (NADPH/NADH) small chain
MNCNVGEDISFDAIRGKHDAVLIATGVYKTRDLRDPGADAAGIVRAIDYLTVSNKLSFGDDVPEFEDGTFNAAGKRVVVIGGGDTAMDCLRTAVRQGATSVKCLYRRDRANMPGSQREVDNAIEEGAEFVWLTQPLEITGTAKGGVAGVRTVRMHLGLPDASGRQSPAPVPGSEALIEADMVIEALGFEPEDLPAMFGEPELAVRRSGTLEVDAATMMTTLDGVFAAGDIVRGASLVVWAVRDGRDVAQHVHAYIRQGAEASSLVNAG